MKHFYFLVILNFLFAIGFSQTTLEQQKYVQELALKGIVLISSDKEISESDKALLSSYNFNSYRKYNQRMKVQLERGPLVELISLKEMLTQNLFIEKEILADKKDEQLPLPTKHDILLHLNIGMGYQPKNYSEIDH